MEDLIISIGSLAFNMSKDDFIKNYSFTEYPVTIHKNFDIMDMLFGVMFLDKSEYNIQDRGFVLNIMKNGDIFAREFPFYDGDFNIIPIYNQRKISDLVVGEIGFNKHIKCSSVFYSRNKGILNVEILKDSSLNLFSWTSTLLNDVEIIISKNCIVLKGINHKLNLDFYFDGGIIDSSIEEEYMYDESDVELCRVPWPWSSKKRCFKSGSILRSKKGENVEIISTNFTLKSLL